MQDEMPCVYLHNAVGFLAIAHELLSHSGAERHLLGIMVPEKPAGLSYVQWLMSRRCTTPGPMSASYKGLFAQMPPGNEPQFLVVTLLGIIDNAANAAPKAAMFGMSLLSLLLARDPASVFGSLDLDILLETLFKYLSVVYGLVANSQCLVEERWGIVALINALPTLYLLTELPSLAIKVQAASNLPVSLATTIINVVHSAALLDKGELNDAAPDPAARPTLASGRIHVEAALGGGACGDLMTQSPMSFAAAAGFEVSTKVIAPQMAGRQGV